MKNHQTFDNWYNKTINENEVVIENPIKPTQTTKIDTDMSMDVDAIINSLETLANELTEEIESIDFNSIFEETNSVVDFVFRAPKARAAQKKVNTLLLKVANLDAAASAATDSEMKKKIATKVTTLKAQADDVQTAVTDKFKSYSDIVQKALNSEKIKGKLAVIKTAMGDSSNDKGDLKSQASKLVVRLKKEEAALSDAAPSDEDKQKLKDDAEAKAAEKAADAERAKDDAEAAAAEKDKKDAEAEAEPNADAEAEPKAEAEAEPKADAEAEPKADAEAEPKADAEAEPKADAEPKAADKSVDGKDKIKGNKEEMLSKLQSQLKNAQDSGNEEKIKKVQSLIDRVSAKESWQIDGTYLGIMFESELRKIENDTILEKLSYLNYSLKDRFANLL
jgi:hypothetical protein